ncbi:uncharacterized protein [Parasteatoda tepidariorum]|uniref:uncharacterized protein isoform X2 n=1 Tax=Parasteatoda tepidariorum TaxID=114398 RepID=UPI0039BC704A
MPRKFRRLLLYGRTSNLSKLELLDLAAALQYYGFSETEKIAEALQTKDENTVKSFLATEVSKVRQKASQKEARPGRKAGISQWYNPDIEDLKNWPASRAWRRVVFDQLMPCVKKNDYSKITLEDLFETFYNEAEEVSDPQVVNVKAVYKYFLDCVRGTVPAELSPVDSAAVLMLCGQLVEMQRYLDFEDEKKFITTFRSARTFAPIKVKDEFRDKSIKRSEELQNSVHVSQPSSSKGENNAGCSSKNKEEDTINVVEDMFMNLTKHRKLVQSFNPLNVPVWTLLKEQGYVQNKCDLTPRVPF